MKEERGITKKLKFLLKGIKTVSRIPPIKIGYLGMITSSRKRQDALERVLCLIG